MDSSAPPAYDNAAVNPMHFFVLHLLEETLKGSRAWHILCFVSLMLSMWLSIYSMASLTDDPVVNKNLLLAITLLASHSSVAILWSMRDANEARLWDIYGKKLPEYNPTNIKKLRGTSAKFWVSWFILLASVLMWWHQAYYSLIDRQEKIIVFGAVVAVTVSNVVVSKSIRDSEDAMKWIGMLTEFNDKRE